MKNKKTITIIKNEKINFFIQVFKFQKRNTILIKYHGINKHLVLPI